MAFGSDSGGELLTTMTLEDKEFYAVQAMQAVHAERLAEQNRRLDEALKRVRALELKWYGVVAGMTAAVAVIARIGGLL